MFGSQASYISSASEDYSKLPLIHNLDTVNEAFSTLGISKLNETEISNDSLIEKKIAEAGDIIRKKLKVEPKLSVGEKVLNQLKDNFGNLEKDDKYRAVSYTHLTLPTKRIV